MKLFWVRHGQTEASQEGQYYGRIDSRLTPEGVQEIKNIKTHFEDCINVYTSPAARAVETASLLFNGIYFKVDGRLMERKMGRFEGMTDEHLKATYPEERQIWYSDWKHYVIPEGESAVMQYERVKEFVEELESLNEDAVIIAHAGTIRMALAYMFGGDLELFWRFKVNTGAVVVTTFEHNHWYIEFSQNE